MASVFKLVSTLTVGPVILERFLSGLLTTRLAGHRSPPPGKDVIDLDAERARQV